MKPLKSQLGQLDGSAAKLAELFAAADHYRKNPMPKRRIKAMVLATRRERRRPLGTALAAVLLIAGTATAATLGHRLFTSGDESTAHAPTPPLVHVPPMSAVPPRVVQQEVAEEPELVETKAVDVEPSTPAKRPTRVQPKPAAQKATPAKSLRPGEDPTRVVQAIRALRQQGDATKAQGLLNDYMKKNPNGALSEEALTLSIEAAHTRKDPKAKIYARRYLARFPNGRHRAFASRVLAE